MTMLTVHLDLQGLNTAIRATLATLPKTTRRRTNEKTMIATGQRNARRRRNATRKTSQKKSAMRKTLKKRNVRRKTAMTRKKMTLK